MKYYFKTFRDLILEIQSNNCNKDFVWKIAVAYVYEEDKTIDYNWKLFNRYGFFFNFLLSKIDELTNENLKEIIELVLNNPLVNIDNQDLKKIIYKNELNELNEKLNKKLISNEIYDEQLKKYTN